MTPTGFSGALVSVHDVMPETLDKVDEIVSVVARAGHAPPGLLVVPGRDWPPAAVDRLRRLADAGHELVGHGWTHRAQAVRGPRHHLHSLLISRGVAEHLALDAAGIAALIRRCARWFVDQDLPRPSLYVPPAWAMGSIGRRGLAGLGFRYFETLGGIYDSVTGARHRIPVVGFEAATAARAAALRTSNAINAGLARRAGALRIAIHPDDLRLRLAGDLRKMLADRRRRAPAPQRRDYAAGR